MRNSKSLTAIAQAIMLSGPPLLGALCGPCAQAAPQENLRRAYDIAPGPLPSVLARIGIVSGASIVFEPSLVAGKRAPAINGALTLREALAFALKDLDLEATFSAEGTVSLRASSRAAPAPAPAPSTGTRPPSPVSQREAAPPVPPDPPEALLTVTVLGKAAKGFAAQRTSSSTRTDTALSDLPASVQIITQDVMRSQQVQSVTEVLKNAAGVTLTGDGAPTIRGFKAAISVNGLADNVSLAAPLGGFSSPIIGVQQVEVLRGPDSILAGSMDPGGVVNLVKKTPQATPAREALLQVGNFGEAMAGFDTTGPIWSDDERYLYRFIVSGERASRNFGGYEDMENRYLAPAFGWNTPETQLLVGMEYSRIRTPLQPYTALIHGVPGTPASPVGSKFDHALLVGTSAYAELAHEFDNDWKLHLKLNGGRGTFTLDQWYLGGIDGEDGFFIPQYLKSRVHGFNTDNNLSKTYKLGGVSHTVLIGHSFQHSANASTAFFPLQSITMAPAMNSLLPDAGTAVDPTPLSQPARLASSTQLYLQDQIAWGPFNVLAGLVHARAWSEGLYDQGKWLPSGGAVYKLSSNTTIYANFKQSFSVQSTGGLPMVGGGSPPPTQGRQTEIGAKFSYLDNKLTSTVSAFRSYQSNILNYVPSQGGYLLSPGNTSRGIEGDIQGRLQPGLDIIGSYTYSSYEDVQQGSSSLPRHQFSLWGTYEIQGGDLKGWGAGLGVFARAGYAYHDDDGVDRRIPGQASVNGSLFYRQKDWQLALAVKNAFDRPLLANFASAQSIQLEPRRTVLLTGSMRF